jgi:hypothetical protein
LNALDRDRKIIKLNPTYKLAIETCPLCGQKLSESSGATSSYGTALWSCPNSINSMIAPYVPVPHYQVEWHRESGNIAQHVVVPPYYIDTFNVDWKSRVHKVNERGELKFVMTTPQLHMDSSEKILERIKTLIIFS